MHNAGHVGFGKLDSPRGFEFVWHLLSARLLQPR
jgi:hypothetical protein